MRIDVLVAEIGSTTTVVNGFENINTSCPRFLGQGQASTSVLEGDVNIGLQEAIEDLRKRLNVDNIEYDEILATSSAAGGLRMTVHGLVYDMTVRAAKEAALGAGANIHLVTGGKLRRTDIKKIKEVKPNIILIAGGVDYGERDTAIYNAELIEDLDLDVPIIYAGNIENQEEIKEIFSNKKKSLFIVENVYPKIDKLNIDPTRRAIQDVFEEHIIHAPGMQEVKSMVTGPIIPTPGAVMEASILFKKNFGDSITLDVGGATTDLHSVTEGSEEINRILISPEPRAKRTVEGDLGLYINIENIANIAGLDKLNNELGLDVEKLLKNKKPIPKTDEEIKFVERLTLEGVLVALERHVGRLRNLYGPGGKTTVAEGKDLSNVKYVIGTGGALTRLPNRTEILREAIRRNSSKLLLPKKEAKVLIDNHYIMASLGVLAKSYPQAALSLMKQSMGIE